MPVQRPDTSTPVLVVIGGGPAGLMAAEVARAAGLDVELYDRMGSVGRKILIAGKGGLNLTHSEPLPRFLARFGARAGEVSRWLERFPPTALREWAQGLGVGTLVGSSGRVFPSDLKAAPLLRGWVGRLRAQGIRFHMNHRWTGWTEDGALRFESEAGEHTVRADAVVLALGGGSWAKLGSDGRWVEVLRASRVEVRALQPSNCGFEVAWTQPFAERHAGQPVKPATLAWTDTDGREQRRQGEFVITRHGIEGSLVYAASADLREAIAANGKVTVHLDLVPGRGRVALADALAFPRGRRSFSDWLRRRIGLAGTRAALLRELAPDASTMPAQALAERMQRLPLTLLRPRPLDEAISSAGGVAFTELEPNLMLKRHPGVFCAGEMLDWEAPTGGYLLNACLASGMVAGEGALAWLRSRERTGGHVLHASDLHVS
ncbi:MAG TPA: TIGR03862 family flavoprotein [Xanthomonadaceae bacterium]|nr:TIGR03862 family flavoprotein [Xanthomonadaceae bacterium]